jgi:hypothetical protein
MYLVFMVIQKYKHDNMKYILNKSKQKTKLKFLQNMNYKFLFQLVFFSRKYDFKKNKMSTER